MISSCKHILTAPVVAMWRGVRDPLERCAGGQVPVGLCWYVGFDSKSSMMRASATAAIVLGVLVGLRVHTFLSLCRAHACAHMLGHHSAHARQTGSLVPACISMSRIVCT